MAIKPTAPAAARNPYAPYSARAKWIAACDEGSGDVLGNLAPTRTSTGAGTLNGSQTWSTARPEGRSIIFGTAGSGTIVGATGGNVSYPRWTMLFDFAFRGNPVDATARLLIATAAAVATNDNLSIGKLVSASTWQLRLRKDAGNIHTLEIPNVVFNDGGTTYYRLTCLATGGEQGLAMWLFDPRLQTLSQGAPGTGTPKTYQGSFTKPAADSITLSLRSGAAAFGNMELLAGAWLDCQITTPGGSNGPQLNRFCYDLIVDPYSFIRELPNRSTELANNVFPITGKSTKTYFVSQTTTGRSLSGRMFLATKVSDSPLTLDAKSITSSEMGIDAGKKLRTINKHSYSPGTRLYKQDLWSRDNVTFYPFAGGIGEVVVQRDEDDDSQYTVVDLSDDHIGDSDFGGLPAANVGVGLDLVLDDSGAVSPNDSVASLRHWDIWRCDHDAYLNTSPDFLLVGNDMAQCDKWATADDAFDAWAEAVCFHFLRWKLACAFFCLGNHDGEYGFHQNHRGFALQLYAARYRRAFFPNPGPDTYAEGGSDWPRAEWIAPENAGSEFVDADDTDPLENAYAFRWGQATWIVADAGRYSCIGQSRAPNADRIVDYSYGPSQAPWIGRVLSASTARYKFIRTHHLLGGGLVGELPYARGSIVVHGDDAYYVSIGYDGEPPNQKEQIEQAESGGAIYIFGHDHTGFHARRKIHAVTVPTSGANTHTNIPDNIGLTGAGMTRFYGTCESGGREGTGGGELGTKGAIARHNVLGFAQFTIAELGASVRFRQSVLSTRPDVDGDYSDTSKIINPSMIERRMSDTYTKDGSDRIDLADALNTSPVPYQIVVFDDGVSFLNTSWTGSYYADNNQVAAVSGDYEFDQVYTNGTVQLDAGAAAEVRAAWAPRWVYEGQLFPPNAG